MEIMPISGTRFIRGAGLGKRYLKPSEQQVLGQVTRYTSHRGHIGRGTSDFTVGGTRSSMTYVVR